MGSKYDVYAPQVKELHASRVPDKEIAKILGVHAQRVADIRKKNGLPALWNVPFEISDEQKQIIIGGLLGDMCIFKDAMAKDYRFNIAHSLKQEQYLRWKYGFLKEFCPPPKISQRLNAKTGNLQQEIRIQGRTNPLFTQFHAEWYDGKSNVVPDSIKELEPLGLAVFYFDDGYKASGGGHYFSVDNYDQDNREKIATTLECNFGLKLTRSSGLKLYVHVESSRKLRSLISEFATPDLEYKL